METNFKKVMRGYDVDEVNNYIDRMILEFDSKTAEKRSELEMLKKQNEKLNGTVTELKASAENDSKKAGSEFQNAIKNMELTLQERERRISELSQENEKIKLGIDSAVKEKDYELSRLLNIKETQIRELEAELNKAKSSSGLQLKEEIKSLEEMLVQRERELDELKAEGNGSAQAECIQLEEKIRMKDQLINDLEQKVMHAETEKAQSIESDLESQKKRIAQALINANEQAEKILFNAQIEAEKIGVEAKRLAELEERKIIKLQKDIDLIKAMSSKILCSFGESIEEVLNEIDKANETGSPKNWSVING